VGGGAGLLVAGRWVLLSWEREDREETLPIGEEEGWEGWRVGCGYMELGLGGWVVLLTRGRTRIGK